MTQNALTGFAQQLDAEVIKGAQAGRRDCQRQLFETYQRPVQRLIQGMCRDHELARDLTQDVFLVAFEKVAQLRDPKALGGWLKQLTVNTALSHFRRPQQQTNSDDSAAQLDADDWLSQTDWLQQLDDIDTLLSVLDEHEYQLIWLYLVEGYSHEELAELLNEQAATVRQRYHRALKKLRQRSSR
ncbi:hypothetical protein IDAT_02750 [Pseudidiomarina atlantica]|jgi:RNA polymerase sigma-70 factor (ECF subfamily)|uniref:RNA polymerase subunit sigma-24 n=1 Tax=Pseudidiomarina atlantica TaxID=1517416 RepID=A0A094L5M6_9GAMM|nr:sigma-70 family RNA polymerase sigma factor [Pseudidiomarina atlantica]KFZ30018.1 hypothetical protein IDAT_02750 [Pseudidiomarina atlantica]